jgi:hypothetical protein
MLVHTHSLHSYMLLVIHACTYVYILKHAHEHVQLCVYSHMPRPTCAHLHECISMDTLMHVCSHVNTPTQIQTHKCQKSQSIWEAACSPSFAPVCPPYSHVLITQQWRECLFSCRLPFNPHDLRNRTSQNESQINDRKPSPVPSYVLLIPISWCTVHVLRQPDQEVSRVNNSNKFPRVLSDFEWHCKEQVPGDLWVWFWSKNRHVGTLEGTGSQILVFEVNMLSVYVLWYDASVANARKPVTNTTARDSPAYLADSRGPRGCKSSSGCTVQVSQSLLIATEAGMASPAVII